ncbi:MAG: NAD(+) synthase [bacterium]|nr:NAD(+) synthase [bacterium]
MISSFSADSLVIDADEATDKITSSLKKQVRRVLRRRGVVVGVSGGIDSSVTIALCVEAFGPNNVLAVFMPERDSESESLSLGRLLVDRLGVDSVLEDIEPALTSMGCYQRRDDFIRSLVPEYDEKWGCKVVLPNVLDEQGYNISSLVVESPDGKQQKLRMPLDVYLGVVAATNMKQRTRKQIEYYHADRLNYVVAGTPNKLEYDQGFFVKNGDGAADIKPIAHLYKSQVYQLADHLGVPENIRKRPPTTDTFSLSQSQEEFYFSLPYDLMDLCLLGINNEIAIDQVAKGTGLTEHQVKLVWNDIAAKRKATRYLHEPPMLVV